VREIVKYGIVARHPLPKAVGLAPPSSSPHLPITFGSRDAQTASRNAAHTPFPSESCFQKGASCFPSVRTFGIFTRAVIDVRCARAQRGHGREIEPSIAPAPGRAFKATKRRLGPKARVGTRSTSSLQLRPQSLRNALRPPLDPSRSGAGLLAYLLGRYQLG
jgi:hypothetical protein